RDNTRASQGADHTSDRRNRSADGRSGGRSRRRNSIATTLDFRLSTLDFRLSTLDFPPVDSVTLDSRLPTALALGIGLRNRSQAWRLTFPHAGLALHPHHDRAGRRFRAGGDPSV